MSAGSLESPSILVSCSLILRKKRINIFDSFFKLSPSHSVPNSPLRLLPTVLTYSCFLTFKWMKCPYELWVKPINGVQHFFPDL